MSHGFVGAIMAAMIVMLVCLPAPAEAGKYH
jgi:hypothetical protein